MIKNLLAGLFLGFAGVIAGCAAPTQAPPGFQGVVELDQRVIAFEVAGRVTSVDARRGDRVKDGAPLVHVDDRAERLARDARAHELEAAQGDLALLQAGARPQDIAAAAAQVRASKAVEDALGKTADRTRALFGSGSLSQAELDRAEADLARATAERQSLEQRLASLQAGARTQELARAKARVAGAEAAVALEDERLARYVPSARGQDLEVLDVHVEPGELAITGAPVATLADTAHPYVDVFVPQNQIDGIKPGARAVVRVDSPRLDFAGAVEDVAHHTEFTPRYLFTDRERANLVVRVRVRVEDPERKLHAGVPSFVTIER